jgi:hypothetical protein
MTRAWHALLLLAPAALFVGLHARTLDYGFVWSDQGEIIHGTLLRPAGQRLEAFRQPLHVTGDFRTIGMRQPYYRPLQVLLVNAVHDVRGAEPRAFRIVSFALGAATATLFATFAWLLFGRIGPGVMAGSIVAVHPVVLETYVWIGGLSAALAAWFVVSSVFCGWLAMRAGGAGARAGYGALCIAAFALGLASKENAAVVPGLLLAVAVCLRRRERDTPARGWWITAGVLIAILAILDGAYAWGVRPAVLGRTLTGVPPLGGDAWTQLLTGVASWPRSLAWLVLPWSSSTSDVIRIVTSGGDPRAWLGLGLALASLVAWIVSWRRGHAAVAFGLAWIWIAFLPTSGILPLLHVRAERNLFLSIFGVALLWPALGEPALRVLAPRASRLAIAGLGALLLLVLAERTWVRAPAWRSTTALFETDVERDPLHREGRFNLALARMAEGRAASAKPHLDWLIFGEPEFEGFSSYFREEAAYEVYCHVNRELRRDVDTVRLFESRLGGDPRQARRMPGFAFCAAHALETEGRCRDALQILDELDRLRPGASDPAIAVAVARCHVRLGELGQAREWLAKVPRETVRDARLEQEIVRVRRMLRRTETGQGPR